MIRLFIMASLVSSLLSALYQPAFANTPECTNLPPSKLQIYNIDTPDVEERLVPAARLTTVPEQHDLVARHTMALFSRNVVAWVKIRHREVPQPSGMVCNAPETVEIGFGSTARTLIMADVAAGNACIRRELTEHERDHSVAFNATLDRFLNDNGSSLRAGMMALKKMPADTVDHATAMWDSGLRLILDKVKAPLLSDLRETNSAVDTPANLEALKSACGGALRILEEQYLYQ